MNDASFPAFPRTAFDKDGTLTTWDEEFKGVTMRQYYAAKAMQGDASAGDGWAGGEISDDIIAHRVALYFRLADAMILEGNK